MRKVVNHIMIISVFEIILVLVICHIFMHRSTCLHYGNVHTANNSSFPKRFYPCIAIIVEFRKTDKVVTVVHNVNYHIPSTWPIQFFHGEQNEDFIRKSTLSPLITSGKLILTLMKTVQNKSLTDLLLTNADFWEQVKGEKVLLFQIDSIMCSNSPHKITDYLEYDYIGAPWDTHWFIFDRNYTVGNGGFSLRSRRKMLELIKLIPYDPFAPEDVWYAQNLHKVNASVAPVEIAKTFSVESIYYERPVGVHRYAWDCDFRRRITETCPESAMLLENNTCTPTSSYLI